MSILLIELLNNPERTVVLTQPPTAEELDLVSTELEPGGAEATLLWAKEQFGSEIALACSFGGPSGMVLVDLSARLGLTPEIFYLDTDVLFPETYALRDEVSRRYRVQPVAYHSRLTLDEQAAKYGPELWTRDPDRCCYLRKVEPNERALVGKRAWISGIRRDQSATRKDVAVVEWDEGFDLVKLNPLAAWSEDDVWAYIRANNVPYNPLHDDGYPSIGCVHCTRRVLPGEDRRAGRWSGFDKVECGIHVADTAKVAQS
jgi:phosphoadenosine phosphosulfate reductase